MHANYVCMYVYFKNGIAALPKYILSKHEIMYVFSTSSFFSQKICILEIFVP